VWLGVHDEPRALAVKRLDGRRGLLAAEDVRAVAREQEWVVVPSSPPLLELDAPRLETRDSGGDARLVASWATTGAALPPASPPNAIRRRPFARARLRAQPATERESGADRVVWHAIALLYVAILFVVTTVISLAFLAAYVVTGRAI
jgi:hypothetical protein